MNGDGKPDIIALVPDSNKKIRQRPRPYVAATPAQMVVMLGLGNGIIGAPVSTSATFGPSDVVIAADINHDGKIDMYDTAEIIKLNNLVKPEPKESGE